MVRRTWYFSVYKLHSINNLLFSLNIVKTSLGDLSGMGTPGPISNPEVKHVSADGTWRATSWESRSLPRGFSKTPNVFGRGEFLFGGTRAIDIKEDICYNKTNKLASCLQRVCKVSENY